MNKQTDPAALQQQLAALYEGYVKRLPDKLQDIRQAADSLRTGTDRVTALRELQALTHKLAGTAGTYGCKGVGEAARHFENLVNSWLEAADQIGMEDREQLDQALTGLEEAIDLALRPVTE